MKRPTTTDHLLRYLEGALPSNEAARLQAELKASPALQRELEELRLTQTVLQQTTAGDAAQAVKPFLADRVLRQLNAPPAAEATLDDLFANLAGLFRPVAFASLLLMLVLASYNIYLAQQYEAETTFSESLLALPPLSEEAVYDLDLYDLQMNNQP